MASDRLLGWRDSDRLGQHTGSRRAVLRPRLHRRGLSNLTAGDVRRDVPASHQQPGRRSGTAKSHGSIFLLSGSRLRQTTPGCTREIRVVCGRGAGRVDAPENSGLLFSANKVGDRLTSCPTSRVIAPNRQKSETNAGLKGIFMRAWRRSLRQNALHCCARQCERSRRRWSTRKKIDPRARRGHLCPSRDFGGLQGRRSHVGSASRSNRTTFASAPKTSFTSGSRWS